MKKVITIVLILSTMLISSCGKVDSNANATVNTEERSERFIGDYPMYMTTDTKTGCEYIRNGGSSWTYVHGSCPEVIAEESGRK